MRTFEDGCAVTLSAAGAAKGFATTKTQSIKLSATLNDKDIHQINWDDIDELEEAPSVDMIHNADQNWLRDTVDSGQRTVLPGRIV